MADLIQFKRASLSTWEELDYVLDVGEPGFVKDTNQLKIGDGATPWSQLPYIGDQSIFNALTPSGFPSIGKDNVIYKAEQNKTLYQWNSQTLSYELIGEDKDELNITLINGGDADGE